MSAMVSSTVSTVPSLTALLSSSRCHRGQAARSELGSISMPSPISRGCAPARGSLFFASISHQSPTMRNSAANRQRRVVHGRPVELVVPRHRGGRERQREDDHAEDHPDHRRGIHPLVLACRASRRPARSRRPRASAGTPASRRRCRGRSPRSRRRRRTPPGCRRPSPLSAGSVMISASTQTADHGRHRHAPLVHTAPDLPARHGAVAREREERARAARRRRPCRRRAGR